ncbi:DUF6998 domain-containing protein [Slackia heliotrinireducens]|uniref:DUF6998 domain-containing protein n=1 Tax=Slackia heliotrinireducens TaxID=84110 RepID=UPI0033155643
MGEVDALSETIRELYAIVKRLEDEYQDQERHFTLDGHLVGSIGEVYAAKRYGLKLFPSSHERHDGETLDGTRRLVQVKATQRNSVGISSEPEHLIVLRINENGEFEEVFNGPGNIVWALFEGKPLPKNGQYQVSVGKLAKLNEAVADGDRV